MRDGRYLRSACSSGGGCVKREPQIRARERLPPLPLFARSVAEIRRLRGRFETRALAFAAQNRQTAVTAEQIRLKAGPAGIKRTLTVKEREVEAPVRTPFISDHRENELGLSS
ncbi:hypothetical protein SKAU_G00086920 [Synaphobranchus kaupii]|uniref:Uncharacterized protein n=1 Tax=Synaphobranchus kaupii TaxID=118154 RepID=A0A9Q1FVL5_SYNKA|nr:hypothetical protein SKAU_G00086920 [Synaphobranchus kaupii]